MALTQSRFCLLHRHITSVILLRTFGKPGIPNSGFLIGQDSRICSLGSPIYKPTILVSLETLLLYSFYTMIMGKNNPLSTHFADINCFFITKNWYCITLMHSGNTLNFSSSINFWCFQCCIATSVHTFDMGSSVAAFWNF